MCQYVHVKRPLGIFFIFFRAYRFDNNQFFDSRYRRSGKPAALAPLLPLSFLVGYQGDLAYGTKLTRIRSEAENILMFERELVDMPAGLPTISALDMGRQQMKDDAKNHVITKDTANTPA